MSDKLLTKIVNVLERIDDRLKDIENKMDTINASERPTADTPKSVLELLMKVPKSQHKTYFAVQKLESATCTEVAEVTGRSHNLESRYLARLHEAGLLGKERVPLDDPGKTGTEVKYFIEEDEI